MDYWKIKLQQRLKNHDPLQVAVIGSGWFGRGLIKELVRLPGITPKIIFTRNPLKAVEALKEAGVDKGVISVVQYAHELSELHHRERYFVSSRLELVGELKGIDAVYEATGDVLAGAQAALSTIYSGMHFVTVNSELDCTVGYILYSLAKENNVIYSNSAGDQPGVLMDQLRMVEAMGFEAILAGNCKGYLNRYKTPEDIMPWVRPGHNSKMVTAFSDGTKQSCELAVLSNATGFVPEKRGMHGITTSKETLIEDYLKIIKTKGIVDFCFGINGVNQGGGVFVIAKRDDKQVSSDMDYLKMGKGPHHLFFRNYHLCYFEAAQSIIEACVDKTATMVPMGVYSEAIMLAKKDLKKGESTDGMGGFTVYGEIEKYETAQRDNLVPVGLSDYAVLKENVLRDTPLTFDMVDFPKDNLVLRLRKKQEDLINITMPLETQPLFVKSARS